MSGFNSFLEINKIRTHVCCFGNWVEETTPDEVVIVIPGNPGLAGFYYPYLQQLHDNTNLPIWTLGHAGHEEPDEKTFANICPIEGNERFFNLEGQYQHKLEFMRRFTNSNTRVHLIGHSIGAWIVVQMLKESDIKDRIVSTQLLFPTIQYMSSTPNGLFVNNVLRRIPSFFLFLVSVLSFLPVILRLFIVKIYFLFNGIQAKRIFYDTVLKYFRRSVMEKVLFMAFDEMDRVKQLDLDTLKNNKNRIKIIYGDHDKWAPIALFKEIKDEIPDLYLKNVPYAHTFCLSAYTEMAFLSGDLVNCK